MLPYIEQLISCSSLSFFQTTAYLKRDGKKTKIFDLPGFGKSNFFMPLKYHGDGEVIQHGPPAKK